MGILPFFFGKNGGFPNKIRLLQLLFRVKGFQWNQRQQGSKFLDGLVRPYDLVVTPFGDLIKDLKINFWLYKNPIGNEWGRKVYVFT